MMPRSPRFWILYTVTVVALSAAVAWSIFGVMQLQDRADQAEDAVAILTDRAPRMPEAWSFRIDDDVVLRCTRSDDDQPVYLCVREEP